MYFLHGGLELCLSCKGAALAFNRYCFHTESLIAHVCRISFQQQEVEDLNTKWAKKLSGQCDLAPDVLQSALEELSESCYGDAETSRKAIEELTLKCHFSEADLKKFMNEVSKNCPMDAKKLHEEIVDAEGNREEAFRAINRVGVQRGAI